jgi:hypothetical protein
VAPAPSAGDSEAAEPITKEIDYPELLYWNVLGKIRNMMSKKKWESQRKAILTQARTRLGEIATTPRSQKVNTQQTMISDCSAMKTRMLRDCPSKLPLFRLLPFYTVMLLIESF